MLAKKLKNGDKIGIIAPSNPVIDDLKEQLKRGINFIESMGFEVELSENIFSSSLGYTADPKEKVEDLHNMFLNSDIKAIICAQGGNTANACLPFIDWDIIRDNPKIFLGLSDISVLLNAIYKKTGLITYHGNDLIWGFGNDFKDYDKEEFIKRFIKKQKTIHPSTKGRKTIINGKASGILLGGNLRCFLKLAGTEYFPEFNNSILFIEGMMNSLDNVDSLLSRMQQLKVFEKVNGIITGYIYGLDNNDEINFKLEDVLLQKIGDRDIPILKALDFGHNCANTILPVGGKVSIDTENKEMKILDDFLL